MQILSNFCIFSYEIRRGLDRIYTLYAKLMSRARATNSEPIKRELKLLLKSPLSALLL